MRTHPPVRAPPDSLGNPAGSLSRDRVRRTLRRSAVPCKRFVCISPKAPAGGRAADPLGARR